MGTNYRYRIPEDELDISGNEVENNIQIDDEYSNGNWFCCGMYRFSHELTLSTAW